MHPGSIVNVQLLGDHTAFARNHQRMIDQLTKSFTPYRELQKRLEVTKAPLKQQSRAVEGINRQLDSVAGAIKVTNAFKAKALGPSFRPKVAAGFGLHTGTGATRLGQLVETEFFKTEQVVKLAAALGGVRPVPTPNVARALKLVLDAQIAAAADIADGLYDEPIAMQALEVVDEDRPASESPTRVPAVTPEQLLVMVIFVSQIVAVYQVDLHGVDRLNVLSDTMVIVAAWVLYRRLNPPRS